MTKILIVVFLSVALFSGVFLYMHFFSSPATPNSPISQKASITKESTGSAVTSDHAAQNVVTNSTATPGASLESRVQSLEVSIADLKQQITSLKKSSSTTSTTSTSSNRSPVFIPLGNTGTNSTNDWVTIPYLEATIDTADYPNYKNAVLEVSLRVFQGSGTAYARLINISSGLAILDSQISTGSFDYTWVSSNAFQLYLGRNTYRVQLKTLTAGYDASVQGARLRINF